MFHVKETDQLIAAIKEDKSLEFILPLIKSASKDLNLNIEYQDSHYRGDSILFAAAVKGRLDLIPALLEAGADPAQGSWTGATALNAIMPTRYSKTRTAPEEDILEVAKLLLEKAPTILESRYAAHGAPGNTPIYDVIKHQKWKLAAYFIEKGANLDQKGSDSDGQTAREKLIQSIESGACSQEVRDLIQPSRGYSSTI